MRKQAILATYVKGVVLFVVGLFLVRPTIGATVWVANGDDVKFYDFAGNYISQFDAGVGNPVDIAVVEDTVWVNGGAVKIYDFGGNYISQINTGPGSPGGIAVVGDTVWVANGDDVKFYDFAGNYISQFIAGSGYPGGIAVVGPLIWGYIDWFDLFAFCEWWLEDGCSDANYSYWCGGADIDRSGNVDFADFDFLGQYWSQLAPEPNAATNPDPNDAATDINITTHLNWTAGSGTACHGVYFGTNATPEANDFQGYQTNTSFDIGTLEPATTYYWQINEIGLGGTTIGEVWSFTTAPAPGQASSPNPPDAETDVNLTPVLSWLAGSDTTSHDVYFGTTAPGEFQGNQTDATFDLGTLEYETTYYWRIDEVGPGGTTTGAVWTFTTMIDPNLVGRWRFDETSGNIAYDSSGNENHGTLFDGIGNGLVWEPNEGALNFDGTNNLSRVSIPTAGMATTAGTFAIWANLAEPQNREDGRNGSGYFFGLDNGSIDKILLYMNNSDTQLDMKIGNHLEGYLTTLSTETWYHIALTWNAGTYAIYMDGLPLDTGTYGGLSSLPSTADIGNNGDSHTQSLHGLVGEVQVYDRALPADEIQELYQDGPN